MALTAANIKTKLAAFLKMAEADLESFWDGLITEALANANNMIQQVLIGELGFTAAQVAAWDNLDLYVKDMSFYYIFTGQEGWGGQDPDLVKQWDRRGDLRKIAMLDGSSEEEVAAGASIAGGSLNDGEVIPVSLVDDVYFEGGLEELG